MSPKYNKFRGDCIFFGIKKSFAEEKLQSLYNINSFQKSIGYYKKLYLIVGGFNTNIL